MFEPEKTNQFNVNTGSSQTRGTRCRSRKFRFYGMKILHLVDSGKDAVTEFASSQTKGTKETRGTRPDYAGTPAISLICSI